MNFKIGLIEDKILERTINFIFTFFILNYFHE